MSPTIIALKTAYLGKLKNDLFETITISFDLRTLTKGC